MKMETQWFKICRAQKSCSKWDIYSDSRKLEKLQMNNLTLHVKEKRKNKCKVSRRK